MSNKDPKSLLLLDRVLRKQFPAGIGVPNPSPFKITIEKINGFELFNTRPYHNYENFSDGYRLTYKHDNGTEFRVQAEDLDDALRDLGNKIKIYMEKQ